MPIEFDPAKDYSNIAKHGVSLSLAEQLDWDVALIWQDARQDYGEERLIALSLIEGRLFYAVFVYRGNLRRIISLRKANQREFDLYEQVNT
ncbi:MAG TPA: BrnT family toxin [Methyloradius sp.]